MATKFEVSGKLPQYKDIPITLQKNQNNILLFDWLTIYRDYEYVPELKNYSFRCAFIVNSRLEDEDNKLCICSTENNTITLDNDNDKIYVILNGSYLFDLYSYDSGIFSLDVAPLAGSNKNYGDLINITNYSRLCSGTWSIDTNLAAYYDHNINYNIVDDIDIVEDIRFNYTTDTDTIYAGLDYVVRVI